MKHVTRWEKYLDTCITRYNKYCVAVEEMLVEEEMETSSWGLSKDFI